MNTNNHTHTDFYRQKKQRQYSSRIDENKNYMKTDFGDQYTDKNVLVTLNDANSEQSKRFFENNFI